MDPPTIQRNLLQWREQFCPTLCLPPPTPLCPGVSKIFLSCLSYTFWLRFQSKRNFCTNDTKAGSQDLETPGPVWEQLGSVLWVAGSADTVPAQCSDGSSDCPALPLPELSRSLRCRGEARSKLSHSFKRGLARTPWAGCHSFWAGSSGMPLPPCLAHSRHLEYLLRPCLVCSHAWMQPCPAWHPRPSSQPVVATLFQFLQVWNVSVYHQCQRDSENLQL